MRIGYARVSTLDQNLNLQIDALNDAGCEKIIEDKISGARAQRPGLDQLKMILREGDQLVVWKLDRLGRSLKNTIEWVEYLKEIGVTLITLKEGINTSTEQGQIMYKLFGWLAELERSHIRERSIAGMKAARARGRIGGRPAKLTKEQQEIIVRLYHEGKHSISALLNMFQPIARPTLYAYIKAAKNKPKAP